MEIENLGVVYRLSVEDVNKAVELYLRMIGQKVSVEKIEPEFEKEYYMVGNFEEDHREIFDGLKVVCKYD